MEQLALPVLPDTIALTAKALLCAEIIIIKMKQEKQPVKPVQQELIAQILQALHAQVVTENAQPAIKALQIAQVAQAGTTYQAQVATHVLLMLVVVAEQTVLTAIHILQNREIAVLERRAHLINISQEQHVMPVQQMQHVTEVRALTAIADIKYRVQPVCWINAQTVIISVEQAAVAVHLTQAVTAIRFLVIADILGMGINVTKIATGKMLRLVLRLMGNVLRVGILHLVGQGQDVINLIGYVTRFHVILCLMSRALPSFFLFVII